MHPGIERVDPQRVGDQQQGQGDTAQHPAEVAQDAAAAGGPAGIRLVKVGHRGSPPLAGWSGFSFPVWGISEVGTPAARPGSGAATAPSSRASAMARSARVRAAATCTSKPHALGVEQVEGAEIAGAVRGLGRAQRLLGLHRQHAVEEGVLLGGQRDALDQLAHHAADAGVDAAQRVLGRALPRGGLFDAGVETPMPHRQVDAGGETDHVVAVALRRRGAAGGVLAVADQGVGEAEGDVRVVRLLGQLDAAAGGGEAGAGGRHLGSRRPRPLHQVRVGEIRQHRGGFGQGHRRQRRLRSAVAQRVEARQQRGAADVDVEQAVVVLGDLGLQLHHRLLETDAGGVARPGQLLVLLQGRVVGAHLLLLGGEEGELVVEPPRLGDQRHGLRLRFGPRRGGGVERGLLAQRQLAEPGEALGDAGGELLRTDPGLGADQERGERRHRVGQRAHLGRAQLGGDGLTPGAGEVGVAGEDVRRQVAEGRRQAGHQAAGSAGTFGRQPRPAESRVVPTPAVPAQRPARQRGGPQGHGCSLELLSSDVFSTGRTRPAGFTSTGGAQIRKVWCSERRPRPAGLRPGGEVSGAGGATSTVAAAIHGGTTAAAAGADAVCSSEDGTGAGTGGADIAQQHAASIAARCGEQGCAARAG